MLFVTDMTSAAKSYIDCMYGLAQNGQVCKGATSDVGKYLEVRGRGMGMDSIWGKKHIIDYRDKHRTHERRRWIWT